MNKNESKYFKSAEKMHTALLTLLDSKDFELISVKEICETAGVNRSTFYLHYDNVNDLLHETVEAVYKDFFWRFGAEGPGALDIDEKNEDELFLVTPKYLMVTYHRHSVERCEMVEQIGHSSVTKALNLISRKRVRKEAGNRGRSFF